MTRWIVPSIAALALLGVGAWLSGCRPQQVDTQASTAPPSRISRAVPAADEVPAGAETHEVDSMYSYTCPMHPEVAQDRPGNCPECGMFLTADTDDDVEYYCPMHPDVVQEDPGRCPDCGMFLEARTISKAG